MDSTHKEHFMNRIGSRMMLALCGCLPANLAVFRGKINFANEIVMHVNPLGAMAAGFVRGVGNYLSHKLV